MGAWAMASLFMAGILCVGIQARPQLFQGYQQHGYPGAPAQPHSALGPRLESRLSLANIEGSEPHDNAYSIYSNFEDNFEQNLGGYQKNLGASDRYALDGGAVGYGGYHSSTQFMQPRQHEHEGHEKHGEVHYHKHEHIHEHEHKQMHMHKHKQKHEHKHMHKQKHEHSHHSEHKHGHKHEHGHHQEHKHDHHHGHDHKHDHHNEHKHDHHHGHKHQHHGEHKHDHKHGHKHDHKHGHKHMHKHAKH